jgi:hypothetical protein
MRRVLLFGIIITILILTCSATHAQPHDKIAQLSLETQNAITKLIKNVSDKFVGNTDLLVNIAGLNDAATALYDKMEQESPGGSVTDSVFFYSLKSAQQAIEILSTNYSADSIRTVTEYLTKDYQTKISASGSTSLPVTTTSIKVYIEVNRNGQLKGGYDVQCNYMWEASLKKGKFRSNEPTNNAYLNLSPGYYIFYVLKDDVVIKTRDVQVDLNYLANPLIIHL